MVKKLCLSVFAIVATTMFASNPAKAAAVQVANGSSVAGWIISFPATAGIALVADTQSGITLELEKFADFSSTEGLSITFMQDFSKPPAAKTISIVDESITNSTTSTFTSFQFLLVSPLNGGQNFASTFTTGGISPFTTSTPAGGTSVTLSGGSIAPTQTAKFGFGATGGDLAINANPVTNGVGLPAVFDLKEIPGVGGNFVPLPAAAWSSLAGLTGLALVGLAKRRRHA